MNYNYHDDFSHIGLQVLSISFRAAVSLQLRDSALPAGRSPDQCSNQKSAAVTSFGHGIWVTPRQTHWQDEVLRGNPVILYGPSDRSAVFETPPNPGLLHSMEASLQPRQQELFYVEAKV